MFHEQIAKLTADHLRTHIGDYLEEISLEYDGKDKVTLTVPKSIDPASVVGGTMIEFDKILPQYGIDVLSKGGSEDVENIFTYNYLGQLNGLVSSTSRDSVDKLCSRHARACENFVKKHRLMHQERNDNFSIVAFAFLGLNFSGAENLGTLNDREVWVAGFSIDLIWVTSEDDVDQHG